VVRTVSTLVDEDVVVLVKLSEAVTVMVLRGWV